MGLLDFVSQAGVVVKKVSSTKGGEYAGPCPGCGGVDRFRVWPADKGGGGSYWCRGCGKGGDDVQFLVDFLRYQYRDAFQEVGRSMPDNYRAAGYRPAAADLPSKFQPRVHEKPVEVWRERAGDFVTKCHGALLENKTALHYLAGRGLDLQAVQGFRLGWFEGENGKNCMFRSRESWGLPTITKENGRKKVLWIPRGIVIPCFKGGEIYRLRIRRPKKDLVKPTDSKYIVVPGSGMEVMGHNPDHKAFVVVEAELDAMMIARRACGVAGTIALGSATNKPGVSVFPILSKALRILVALDYDAPGNKAAAWWLNTFPNAKQWPVPMGKDPGEAFEKGIDIKAWVTEGLPPVLTMDASQGYQVPDDVYPLQELQLLLQKYPIKIQAEPDHTKIIFDSGFKNRAIRQRVKDLYYGDDEVHWFLRMKHPDTIITGENCKVLQAV